MSVLAITISSLEICYQKIYGRRPHKKLISLIV